MLGTGEDRLPFPLLGRRGKGGGAATVKVRTYQPHQEGARALSPLTSVSSLLPKAPIASEGRGSAVKMSLPGHKAGWKGWRMDTEGQTGGLPDSRH